MPVPADAVLGATTRGLLTHGTTATEVGCTERWSSPLAPEQMIQPASTAFLAGRALRPDSIGRMVSKRRADLGLSQTRLARLAGMSRAAISRVEAGTMAQFGSGQVTQLLDLLGLPEDAKHPPSPSLSRGLQAVCRTVSVGYRLTPSPEALATVLASGELPPKWLPHIATMLDEAPLKFIVAAVDEAARAHGVPARRIWRHLLRWAHELKSPRPVWA